MAPRPNILVIVLDDVGLDDLASVPTPSIDALAARGVTFECARTSPLCSPTRRALHFGRFYAEESGPPCLPPTGLEPQAVEVSLAEALSYPSSAVLGKWHVGTATTGPWELTPQGHGYGHWLAGQASNVAAPDCAGTGYWDWLRVDDGASAPSTDYEPTAVRDVLLAGWASSAAPRLGVVCPQLAHGPFHAPPAYLLPPMYPSPVTARERYEAMIVALDTIVGQMVAAVNLETTLVVVLGDNGTPSQVAPDPTRAKGTTFERGVRVPMVVAGAGVSPAAWGSRRDESVHAAVDAYATLTSRWGTPNPLADGVDLSPALAGGPLPPRPPMVLGVPGDLAAVLGDLKLRRAGGPDVLYDLDSDPGEQTDVSGQPQYAAEEALLRATLDAFEAR